MPPRESPASVTSQFSGTPSGTPVRVELQLEEEDFCISAPDAFTCEKERLRRLGMVAGEEEEEFCMEEEFCIEEEEFWMEEEERLAW